MKAYLKNLTFAQKKTKNGFLIIFLQEKKQFPMKRLQSRILLTFLMKRVIFSFRTTSTLV